MYYSYAMGIDNIDDLLSEGFIIQREGSSFLVSFTKEKADVWESFISRQLKLNYWNEYLAEDCVVFLFHLEDGIKKYVVKDYNNSEVLHLCEKLCNQEFGSIKAMLEGNRYYLDKLR
jgi:hypothetical protein